jgi:hypothetical protein
VTGEEKKWLSVHIIAVIHIENVYLKYLVFYGINYSVRANPDPVYVCCSG